MRADASTCSPISAWARSSTLADQPQVPPRRVVASAGLRVYHRVHVEWVSVTLHFLMEDFP